MKPMDDSAKATFKWSQWSFWCNLIAPTAAVLAVYTNVWIFLLVDVLALGGLALFLRAGYECARAKTHSAFMAFMPALVVQIVVLAVIGVAFWFFWTMPDSAKS